MGGRFRAIALTQRQYFLPVAHGFAKGGALNMRWYTEALTRRDALIGAMQAFLSDWDAWICPVAAGSAFTHRQMMSILGSPLD